MTLLPRRTRSAIALTALAAAFPLASASSATAAPQRTAATSTYTSALYLQSALGLPASETNPAIESVTLDRFQWILQQDGKFPILIGDPASDPSFAARAQDVEAAADAAGIKDVYWFNPNLSGNAKVGATTVPPLDIRNPEAIKSYLENDSAVIFGDSWLSLVGQYLGNGVTAGPKTPGAAKIVATKRTATVNDAGATPGQSTEVGNASGGALYDYTTSDPADATESYFLIYDKARTSGGAPSKIASWIDLTDEPSSARTKADVATAVGTVGASNLATRSEFAWWKSANNAKQAAASASEAQGKNTPVLTDEDDAAADGGWRVHQVTYPELVFLLKTETSKDAVLLFGGTWCPNTRPVISAVNEEAQENDVTVFNFDTILDGGTDGGGNASTNPLQVRNTAGTNAASTLKTTPSFLYAELVKQYLSNIKTEYDPTTNSTVTYYPGADNSKPLARINKLQVPFVVGYKGQAGDAPHGGATRQWIIDKGDGKYTEYMSQYWFTRPAANQLGITTIPLNAPIWTKINAALADFTWQTDPTALYANTATDADDTDFLAEGDKGKVTEAGGNVTVASTADPVNGTNVFDASPSTLATALSALGADAPANFAAAKAAYLAAKAANAPTVADLQKVVAAWGVAQIRKTRVNSTWGNATSPGSVAGGIAALRALDRFFAGLPGGVVSTQTVSAPSVDAATAPTISLAIANEFDRVPTGSVSVVVKKGGATVASTSAELGDAKATFTLPVLAAGEYEFTVSYAGGDAVAGFSKSGTLTVTALAVQAEIKPTPVPVAGPAPTVAPKPGTTVAKVAAGKVSGAVAKAPTAKKPGTYKVTVKAAGGKAAASGKVTLVLKKGKTKKTLTGAVKNGVVTIKVPKLAKGTWKVTISWVGDATYTGARVSGGSIKVKK